HDLVKLSYLFSQKHNPGNLSICLLLSLYSTRQSQPRIQRFFRRSTNAPHVRYHKRSYYYSTRRLVSLSFYHSPGSSHSQLLFFATLPILLATLHHQSSDIPVQSRKGLYI